ncbi:hypothetical protein LXL04_012111 [Taraxacum kok-saghyz]
MIFQTRTELNKFNGRQTSVNDKFKAKYLITRVVKLANFLKTSDPILPAYLGNCFKEWLQVEVYSIRKGSWELITQRFSSNQDDIDADLIVHIETAKQRHKQLLFHESRTLFLVVYVWSVSGLAAHTFETREEDDVTLAS